MDTITTILGIIAGIIVVVLILALIAPKEYGVQRSIIINKHSRQIFDYVKFLRNM